MWKSLPLPINCTFHFYLFVKTFSVFFLKKKKKKGEKWQWFFQIRIGLPLNLLSFFSLCPCHVLVTIRTIERACLEYLRISSTESENSDKQTEQVILMLLLLTTLSAVLIYREKDEQTFVWHLKYDARIWFANLLYEPSHCELFKKRWLNSPWLQRWTTFFLPNFKRNISASVVADMVRSPEEAKLTVDHLKGLR